MYHQFYQVSINCGKLEATKCKETEWKLACEVSCTGKHIFSLMPASQVVYILHFLTDIICGTVQQKRLFHLLSHVGLGLDFVA
jgi:hypothetical protein